MLSGVCRPASVFSLISEFQETMGHFYLKRRWTVFQRMTSNIPVAFIHMHVHSHVYVYICIYEHIYICIETLIKSIIIKINLNLTWCL